MRLCGHTIHFKKIWLHPPANGNDYANLLVVLGRVVEKDVQYHKILYWYIQQTPE